MADSKQLRQRRKHRLQPAVYSFTGHEFHFTICGRRQRSPFLNTKLAEVVIESLMWTRKRFQWYLFCYCLMPDHLHFVCRLRANNERSVKTGPRGFQPEGILDHVARFKSFTTHESWKYGLRGELWQKSSYDRVIDLQKPFDEIVQYVLENPVRKGLVEKWDEWPHSAIVDLWD